MTITSPPPRRREDSSAGEAAPVPARIVAAWSAAAVGSLATIGTKFNAVTGLFYSKKNVYCDYLTGQNSHNISH